MDKVSQGPARFAPAVPPRFSFGRVVGGGLVACLWVWTGASVLAAGSSGEAPAEAAYHGALASFNRGDDARALAQLESVPMDGTPRTQADIFNLRGAIYLRQHRYAQAQADFARATKLDPKLWAARFNEAEVNFRQKHYAESRRQFAALLDQTSRLLHNEEHRFVEYKLLLAGICAGDDQPALAFLANHRDDAQLSAAWYYLNAALERQHGRAQKADQWIAQANATVGAGHAYAESFERLGWGSDDAPAGRDAAQNIAAAEVRSTRTPGEPSGLRPGAGSGATVAVVQVMPAPSGVEFRDSSEAFGPRPHGRPLAPDQPADPESDNALPLVVNAPPGGEDPAAAFAEILRTGHDTGPATLALPRKGKGKASPSPSPSASPDASPGATANQGGSPSPGASPASSPTPEFTEKYEAAYVKFLEKNYPDTLSLLDEADKIQPGQPQSVSLRFKSHYALAYLAYRKQDYPGALTELDSADQTQKNADSYNLRGLIFSKQHNYDQAEAMFHKSVVTDPALWAAKFNYAELPFNRGDYTNARTRFEELFSQTDVAKQPREAELTQYKVFLTLLLEGKVEAASTFMDHLNFTGATPARYFCNAALNFRAGSVDRAKNWIDDAKKEYPPQLVAIFIESFYRLGWMADPNAPPGTMVAQATPAGTPSVTTSGTQPTTVTTATAAPSAAPSATVVASASVAPTPIIMAAASPTPTPFPTPVLIRPSPAVAAASVTPAPSARPTASATPLVALATSNPTPTASARPAASPSPAVVAATPSPSATPTAVAVATPRPSVSASPAIAAASPTVTASPARPVAAATGASPTVAATAPAVIAATTPTVRVSPTPRPAASVPAVVLVPKPTATPARSVPVASASPTPVVAQVTPTPAETPVEVAAADRKAHKKRNVRIVVLVLVLGQAILYLNAIRGVLLRRKQREMRAAARRRDAVESSK